MYFATNPVEAPDDIGNGVVVRGDDLA